MNSFNYKKFGSLQDTGDFAGKYIADIKEALVVAALSDVHVMLIGKPGCGKTSVSISSFTKMFGDKSIFIRFSPTTEPESITGIPIPAKFFDDGLFQYNPDNTVSDPRFSGMILDEFQRLNDSGLELMMQRLDRNGMPPEYEPVAVACVNWIPKGDRMTAPIDRFGMMLSISEDNVNTANLVGRMLESVVSGRSRLQDPGGGIPDGQTILDVRNAKPGLQSRELVSQFLDDFVQNCVTGLVDSSGAVVAQFAPNNRRLMQWAKIVMRMSVYYTGEENFASIPAEAKASLRFAWVTQDVEKLGKWQQFMSAGVVDPVDGIISVMMEQAFMKMGVMWSANIGDQLSISKEFGRFVKDKARELSDAMTQSGVVWPEDDERYKAAFSRLKQAFVDACAGKPPVGGDHNE